MLRILPPALALGLATLWVMGISVDATVWLVWAVGAAAPPTFAVIGLIPERASSTPAALCLLGLGLALLALWLAGVVTHATAWLTWWTLVFGALSLASAVTVGLQGAIDSLRTRDEI
jgi:hypothetical protein